MDNYMNDNIYVIMLCILLLINIYIMKNKKK